MFGVVPKSIWNRLHPADDNNLCNWAMRCLLIEDEGRRILIDTGLGDKQDAKFFGHYHLNGDATLSGSLAQLGFSNADITDVFLTHLHFDHCGGAVVRRNDELVPAFPNAVYWSCERHWNWAVNPNDREKASFLKENILPLQQHECLKFIQEDGRFTKSVSVRFAYGHTDAMMLPQISYKGRQIVYMADLLPSVHHIPIPYVMAYDMFPLKTLEEKKAFLTEAVKNNYVLFFEHDPLHECCDLMVTDRGIRPANYFKLSDL